MAVVDVAYFDADAKVPEVTREVHVGESEKKT